MFVAGFQKKSSQKLPPIWLDAAASLAVGILVLFLLCQIQPRELELTFKRGNRITIRHKYNELCYPVISTHLTLFVIT